MALVRVRRMAGFTLLELLVTLVIAMLALSVVAPRFEALLPGVVLKGETRAVAAFLRYARSRSIASGEVTAVTVSGPAAGRMLLTNGRSYEVDQTVHLTLDGAGEGAGEGESPFIAFYPNGGSSGGRVHLSQDGQRYRIEVNWLTGGVAIHD